ncbi:MAG: CBS domain-containing protein [Actinobacteria bacterium]|nr:CBS domain-containing protein [Actinomycetota bacterium]MBW3650181.1 CBS domain-containing protein [Actinomycetota bacterium]
MKVEVILAAKGHAVETIRPDANVAIAVHRLTSQGIGALVVSADGERLDGVLSERDVTRGLARHGSGLLEMKVSAVMSKAVPVCSPETTIKEAMAEMTRSRHRHLPVVQNGVLRGLLSIGDVVKHRLEEMELEASVLRDAYIVGR